jgi:hypothetical protein
MGGLRRYEPRRLAAFVATVMAMFGRQPVEAAPVSTACIATVPKEPSWDRSTCPRSARTSASAA